MASDALVTIGKVARLRRRYLRLSQTEVEALGGPSAATLRKFEGGRQDDYSLRTYQQIERALDWPPNSISDYLTDHEAGIEDLDHRREFLLNTSASTRGQTLPDDVREEIEEAGAVTALLAVLEILPFERRDGAARAALAAIAPYLQDDDLQDEYMLAARRPGRASQSDLQREAQDRDAEG